MLDFINWCRRHDPNGHLSYWVAARMYNMERAAMTTTHYQAIRCNCGHRACQDWHVGPFVADVQGVKFTKEQAEAVAALLNRMQGRS
jgi:hypothetical protein